MIRRAVSEAPGGVSRSEGGYLRSEGYQRVLAPVLAAHDPTSGISLDIRTPALGRFT
jgi:hypothetical protein